MSATAWPCGSVEVTIETDFNRPPAAAPLSPE